MAKQKFRCEGVLRKTGQRVAVEVSAESKEMALKLADQHGVTVQRIGLAQAQALSPKKPTTPRSAPADLDENDEKVDGLLDNLDPSDPFDLAGAAAGPALSGPPSMKACPYCGEPILAVAIKCKHCGSVLPVGAPKAPKARQPLPDVPSPGGSRTVKLILIGAAVMLLLLIGGAWAIYHFVISPVTTTISQVVSPLPAAPQPPVPKPEAPKASPEELAFAKKLIGYLDVCDATAKVLEEGASPNADKKRHDALSTMVARHSTIGAPPKGVAWAEDAAKDAAGLAEVATFAIAAVTTNEAFKDLGQPAPDPTATASAFRDTARKISDIVAAVRVKIPPACLPK